MPRALRRAVLLLIPLAVALVVWSVLSTDSDGDPPSAARDVRFTERSTRADLATPASTESAAAADAENGNRVVAVERDDAEPEQLGTGRYPTVAPLLAFEGVPLDRLDFDSMDEQDLLAFHREVRELARTMEADHLATLPGWEASALSQAKAAAIFADDPDAYFAEVQILSGRGFVELLGALPPALFELRDLSIELTSHPTLVAGRRREAGQSFVTNEPLGVVEWTTKEHGLMEEGLDANGAVICRSRVRRVGAP